MRIQNPQAVTADSGMAVRRGTNQAPEQVGSAKVKSDHGDALELSLSTRISALSSQVAAGLTNDPTELHPDQMVQIQNRIASGFYNDPQIAAATADQVIEFYRR